GLFVLPRATSGYVMLPTEQMAMLSQLGGMGIWTHSIRPDDLFANPPNYPDAAPYRNPDTLFWRGNSRGKHGLFYRLDQWLSFNKANYPWLRYMPTAEAAGYIRDFLENKVSTSFTPDTITVKANTPTYFQIRINNGAQIDSRQIQGAEVVDIRRSG